MGPHLVLKRKATFWMAFDVVRSRGDSYHPAPLIRGKIRNVRDRPKPSADLLPDGYVTVTMRRDVHRTAS
jgi:hypothetical protein